MKQTLFAVLVFGTAGFSDGITAQSMSLNQSQQIQFLWEKLDVPYDGIRRNALQTIFANKSREHRSFCLALCHRNDTIPNHLLSSGLDTLEHETILLASCQNLPRGWCSFVLPTASIANEHLQGSWTLIHDGISQPLTPNQPLSIYVEESTTLTSIGLRLDYDSTSLEQHLIFPTFASNNCPEPDLPPWPITNNNDPWWIGCFHEGQPITGQALLKISADGIFDQPIILCEGFDPAIGGQFPLYGNGDMNWETIWNCSATPSNTFESMPSFIDSLNSMGMDFVFLDFSNGTQTVAKSAALLKHLIGLCLENQSTGSPSPLVIVGASMGGLIGRHALREMELEGVRHCTRLFISIDSPFRGAWLPLSLQHAVEFLSEVSVNASNLQDALQSPAAQQMLFETITGPSTSFMEHQSLQQQWGLPQNPVCAAVSNGNPTIAFPSINAPLLHATSSFLGWDVVNLWLYPAPGDPEHPYSNSNHWSVFDGHLINTDWSWGEDFILEGQGYCSPSYPAIGNLSGSASAHMTLLRNALEDTGIDVNQSQEQSMFIPVNSAFDIPIGSEWSPDAPSFDMLSVQPITRPVAMHVDISDHTDNIMEWIVEGKPIDNVEYEHHFGWAQPYEHWIGDCLIPPSGTITIGGPLGNGISGQGPFEVETAPCSNAIEMPQYGTLILGDTLENGIGLLNIQSESKLIIGPGSIVHVGPSSILNIQKNAELVLAGGEVVVHPGGTLQIHKNGRILIQDDSNIRCKGVDSKVIFNGDLIVSDSKTLSIKSTSNQAGGSIEISESSAYVYLGNNSKWNTEGQITNSLFFALGNQSGLSINGPGLFELNHVELILNEASTLQVNSKSQFTEVGLQGSINGSQCHFFNRLAWQKGNLQNAIVYHKHQSSASMQLSSLHAFNTEWSADESGVHMSDCIWTQSAFSLNETSMHSWIRNSTFTSGISEIPQLQIENSENPVRIESSIFSSHSTGLHVRNQQINFTCNKLQNLSNSIHLDSLALLNIAPPFGKNKFLQNNRHIKFTEGLWPELLEGGNEFSQPDYQYFQGTLLGLQDGDNGMILLACNGNDWGHCSGNGPCLIAPISLESSNNGTMVLLKDATPMMLECENSEDNEIQPDQDSLKASNQETLNSTSSWLVYPNPTKANLFIYWILSQPHPDQAHLKLFDASGNLVLSQTETPDINGGIRSSIGALVPGWYSLHINAPNESPEVFKIIISAP